MIGRLSGQRFRLGLAAVIATAMLGGGVIVANTPALAATTSVQTRSAGFQDCEFTWMCNVWQVNVSGTYQFNGSQAVFTSIHYWSSHTNLVDLRLTWCGASPASVIGCNWTVVYHYPVCDGLICDVYDQTVNYWMRIFAYPNGSVRYQAG